MLQLAQVSAIHDQSLALGSSVTHHCLHFSENVDVLLVNMLGTLDVDH